MRKVTQEIVQAWQRRQYKRVGNTYTDGVSIWLHGNKIVTRNKYTYDTHITNAGWPTNTTKERLNGVPGVHITQKDYTWYLNGKEWGGEWVNVDKWGVAKEPSEHAYITRIASTL